MIFHSLCAPEKLLTYLGKKKKEGDKNVPFAAFYLGNLDNILQGRVIKTDFCCFYNNHHFQQQESSI